MTTPSALANLLSGVAAAKGFELDSRTIQANLEFIEHYTHLIPYLPDLHHLEHAQHLPGAEPVMWDSVFFTAQENPQQLAQLYRNRDMADGTLWPQQALLLAFLEVLQTPRALLNYLPYAHRDLYYRQLLGLVERPAEPAKVALGFLLSSKLSELLIPQGTLFSAGQDPQGTKIQYALDSDLLANQSQWTDLRWCWPQGSGATSFIAYQKPAPAWPTTGLRLFSENAQDQAFLGGRLLVSALLAAPDVHSVFLTFASAVSAAQVGEAQVSGGDHWLPLQLDNTQSSATVLAFSLAPADVDSISAPVALDGITLEQPVLRLTGAVNQNSLPPITQLRTNNSSGVSNPQQYVLTPFGYSLQAQPVVQAQLYLGFTAIQPTQTLSLFWQLTGAKALGIDWQYLNTDNQWASLDNTVIDQTAGLFRSGLWSAIVPADASVDAPSMPAGRYWIRALMEPAGVSVTGVSDYPLLSGLLTNGMTATLQNPQLLDASTLAEPLPADSISQPLTSLAGLAGTLQPWASWDGRPDETTAAFFERSAQRLVHRNRALTWQDMVAMLKARFKAVFDVAIPASLKQTMVPAQRQQRLIVIPVNAEKDNADALRPRFNNARLQEMADYLAHLASPWQDIVVHNPTYVDVRIVYEVQFHPWMNPDYGYRELHQALAQHYMPWAEEKAASLNLANQLDYYDVVSQVQQQLYVDHVISLTLNGQRRSIEGADDEVLILVWPESTGTTGSAT